MIFSDENPVGEFDLYGTVPVIVKDKLEGDINLQAALEVVEDRMPPHFLQELEAVYVGSFPHLEERELDASYEDGVMYVSNVQDSVEDMISDIIHETAHVVEESYGLDLYGDGKIEQEFLIKRKKLLDILKHQGYNVHRYDFLQTEYDEDFDFFLYQDVTYPTLTNLTIGLFVTPYGATSLREYFANGFEEFFTGNGKEVKNISPEVFNKIEILLGE